jgi:hypothetical protein
MRFSSVKCLEVRRNAGLELTSSGVAFLNTREQITKQSVVLTLNRQF